jgi:disulfide oxidoreductase YuzD
MSDCDNLIRRSNSISWRYFGDLILIDLNFLVLYVKYYSIISASCVSDESSFSKANFLQRQERRSLSSENFRYTMILKQKKALQELKFLD